MPGALVAITETDTKTVVNVKSSALGRYLAPLLMPGNYSVAVTAAGFKKEVRTGIVLLPGRRSRRRFLASVGAIPKPFTVTAEAPLIDTTHTDSGTASTTVPSATCR